VATAKSSSVIDPASVEESAEKRASIRIGSLHDVAGAADVTIGSAVNA
jgi:hypothetical protein